MSPAGKPANTMEALIETRTDLLGLNRERLAEALAPVIDRPFRAEQVYQALYARAVAEALELALPPRFELWLVHPGRVVVVA